jgi:aspartyl/asparaginyl beta-hydroxylase (cupin superfamily)
MFVDISPKVNTQEWHDNYKDFVSDYQRAMEDEFHYDYVHEININVDDMEDVAKQLKSTGYFWQVTPLILSREVMPFIPEYLQKSKTIEVLMSNDVKPVLAVFSTLLPNSIIDPHIDTDDEIVTGQGHLHHSERDTHVIKYHMGLTVPTDGECGLVVGDETRLVEENKILPFNETATHYAYNRSSKKRGVLIVSYLHNEIY